MEQKALPKNHYPILVAEDDPLTRRLLETILTKAGYQVISAQNGAEALRILNGSFFPIVITDWMMPETDGLELCRAIRKVNFPGYIFIIIITANDSKDDIISGLQAGADDYLTKPFNHAELRARIATAVRILNLEHSLKEANEKIKRLSVTDSLTGVYNRGFLTERLPQDLGHARENLQPISLIMCDIDRFKEINDHYGHQTGDAVLIVFADCLKNNIRLGIDWVTRYGGEEFLVVLPGTDASTAGALAEKIRRALMDVVVNIEDHDLRFTASFGVSSLSGTGPHAPGSTPEALINEADRCLYQAKHEGRNRVIIASPAG